MCYHCLNYILKLTLSSVLWTLMWRCFYFKLMVPSFLIKLNWLQVLNLTELELNRVDIRVGLSGSLYFMDGSPQAVRQLRNLVSQVCAMLAKHLPRKFYHVLFPALQWHLTVFPLFLFGVFLFVRFWKLLMVFHGFICIVILDEHDFQLLTAILKMKL